MLVVSVVQATANDAYALTLPLPRMTIVDSSEVILGITRINPGCYPDTVWGRRGNQFSWLPTRITWGGFDSLHIPPCFPGPSSRPKRRETKFEFPPWTHLSVSLSLQRLNTSDTLDDMVFFLAGGVTDTTDPHDSVRSVVVWGQSGLDSLALINIGTLPAFQAAPFFAMDLRVGTNFTEPASRDLSHITSYILLPVSQPVPQSRTERPAEVAWDVKLYPNPAVTSTQIEGRPVPPGDYRVEVIAVNGALALEQEISVAATGQLLGTLDLGSLPSGYYVVRLYNRSTPTVPVGTYPIIKSH